MINAPEFEKKQILFAFLSSGEKVTFLNDNVVIKDCSGKIKHQSTCYRLYILFPQIHNFFKTFVSIF